MNVYRRGGITGFWQGTSAKMVESALKGSILLFSKEAINGSMINAGVDPAIASKTWAEKGVKGFYPGGTAIAARQASNWASRQGFTEIIRTRMKLARHGDEKAKLTT